MTGPDTFSFDHHRITAALALEPAHFTEMQRLTKLLRHGSGFQFLILAFNDAAYRTQLVRSLDNLLMTEGIAATHIDLVARGFSDIRALETEIRGLVQGNCAIHLFGGEAWLDKERIEAFNIRREAFARIGPVKLLLWLTSAKIAELATSAPDLWSWRGSTVFAFASTPHEAPAAPFRASAGMPTVDPRTLSERGQRIVELRAMMKSAAIPDNARGLLQDELAGLLESLGDLDEALRIRKDEELPVYEKLGCCLSVYLTGSFSQ